MIDAKALGLELAAIVKAQIEPMAARIADLEKRLAEAEARPAPVNVASALIDREGNLILTMSDGAMKDLGPVVGKDGAPGEDGLPGKDGTDGLGVAGALIDSDGNLLVTLSNGEVKGLGTVVGKDGVPGKAGRDGFSLSDFDATLMEDGRTVLLSFGSGDQSFKVELGIPAMIYRGVYQDGTTYQMGDTVTWGGSLWHCDTEKTAEKPDSAEKHWTLAAKKGRDGKDGVMKEAKAPAPLRIGGDVRNG